MKIIQNRIIPFGRRFYAINLFGILFAKGPCDWRTINHEQIHTAQIREWGFIFFYILYLLEWIVRIIQYRSFYKGYENISFEREAYRNDADRGYLAHRRLYSSLKYIRNK